jgi:hypothetical protein
MVTPKDRVSCADAVRTHNELQRNTAKMVNDRMKPPGDETLA